MKRITIDITSDHTGQSVGVSGLKSLTDNEIFAIVTVCMRTLGERQGLDKALENLNKLIMSTRKV